MMKQIKLRSQSKGVTRTFVLLGFMLGCILAFTCHPVGGIKADNDINFLNEPDIIYYDVAGNERAIMSYNLGATSTDIDDEDSYGYYYQWGRNEPGLDPNYLYQDYSYDYNIDFKWTTGAQGPCPDGYHIPTIDEWQNLFLQRCEDNENCDTKDIHFDPNYYGVNRRYYSDEDGEDLIFDFMDMYNLPAAGYLSNYSNNNDSSNYGNYWASSQEYHYSNYSYYDYLYFEYLYGNVGISNDYNPLDGKSIRCVDGIYSSENDPKPVALNIYSENGGILLDRIFVALGKPLPDTKILKLNDLSKLNNQYDWYIDGETKVTFDGNLIFTENDVDESTHTINLYGELKCGDKNKQYVNGECKDMKWGTIVNDEGEYKCIVEGAEYDNKLQQCVYRTSDFTLMSTNLGVTQYNDMGLYYQWGKKYGFDGYDGNQGWNYDNYYGGNYNSSLNEYEYELFNSYDIEENMCYIWPEEENPCPKGFHIPSTEEWNTLFMSWCADSDLCDEDELMESEIPGRYSIGDPSFGGAYQDVVYQFIKDYNLPLAGSRDNGNIWMLGGMGDYWSSEYGVGAVPYYREGYLKSWGFTATPQGGLGPVSFISNFGASVRCFAGPEPITVTFKLNLNEGDDVVEIVVNKGDKLKKSDMPTRDGYGGIWYIDSKLTNEFDMNTPITGDITLYAKWVEKGIFYKDGYIKISNGDKTYYIKDRNVGATVSQGVPEIEMKFALIDDKAGKLSNQYGWGSEGYETQLLEYTKELLGIEFDSTDDMRDYLNNPLSYEYYNLLYDKYDEELLSIIENISQENFDDLDAALDYVNNYPYNSEYGNAISNKQSELQIQYNYDYDAYKDILLEYANELLGKSFDNMEDVRNYVNNTLKYDVRYEFYDMYGEDKKDLIESIVDKQFDDLDTALYYINYYNPYNPEYGEVNINAFGNYYFRGNNNGVKYIDLEFDDIGMITNMETLVQEKGFNGGKIGSDDTGREEGKMDNPCNGENEYFPTSEDWKELLGIRTNINGYNLDRYGESFYDTILYYLDDENGNGSYLVDLQFANDLLIPSAGYIENMGLNDYRNLRTLQDSGGYVGSLFGDDGVGIQYSLVDNVIDNRYGGNGSINNIAMPVRCFLNIEEPEIIPTYTVSFVVNGGSTIEVREVEEGYKLILSELVPTRDGYTFIGWYVDENLTTPYNFDDVVEDDITLYAKWEKITIVPATTSNGGARLRKDRCPGGDYSDSYYDGKCGRDTRDDIDNRRNEKKENERKENQHSSSVVTRESPYQRGEEFEFDIEKYDSKYSYEMNQAYQYSYYYGITTRKSVERANLDGNLTRAAMAKMLSQYAINVLGMEPDKTRQKVFKDVSTKMDADYDNGITLSYQLGIMGINMGENFRPNDLVTRGQFVTALSRMKYGTPDGKDIYYSTHMNILQYLGIIKNADPKMLEKRGYVMLMLMRSGDE